MARLLLNRFLVERGSEKESLDSPEGIERRHIHEAGGGRMHGWPFGPIGLGVLVIASALGWFGTETLAVGSGDGVTFSVDAPTRIRNGEFFEMTFTVETSRDIEELVLGVDEGIWTDLTINTVIPAPSSETFAGGAWQFSFGPLRPGDTFSVKVDGQINPDHQLTTNEGRVTAADGEEVLADLEHAMEVLP